MSDQATNAADISLAADFETPSQADWEREVLKVLNRRRPEGKELGIEQAYKRLTSTTVDGLSIKPLYTREDGPEELGYPAGLDGTAPAFLTWRVLNIIPDIVMTGAVLLGGIYWIRNRREDVEAAEGAHHETPKEH